jgi:prepilin-type N-terminal cleavage/methylation domain-containing protein
MRCQPANLRRSAFTVIELLIVIAIIAIIVSLTLGAVQAIYAAQDKKNTELTIKRLWEAITAQRRAVIQQANELPPPANVVALAGGDQRRAKVIWIKLQLKRNFPITFREAIYPWAIDGNPPAPLGTGLATPLTQSDLPPLKQYVDAVNTVVSAGNSIAPAGTYSPDEASHLLYLSLSIDRRGTRFVPEQQLGAGGIYIDPSGQGGLSGFKDAWDLPIVSFRWPTDYPDNLVVTSGDLDDPEGRLIDTNWNNLANQAVGGLVYWFEQLCHPIHNPATGAPVAFYAPPAIVSGGPDKRLGLLMTPSNPTVSPNFGMALDPADPQGPNDNTINYTLK